MTPQLSEPRVKVGKSTTTRWVRDRAEVPLPDQSLGQPLVQLAPLLRKRFLFGHRTIYLDPSEPTPYRRHLPLRKQVWSMRS